MKTAKYFITLNKYDGETLVAKSAESYLVETREDSSHFRKMLKHINPDLFFLRHDDEPVVNCIPLTVDQFASIFSGLRFTFNNPDVS